MISKIASKVSEKIKTLKKMGHFLGQKLKNQTVTSRHEKRNKLKLSGLHATSYHHDQTLYTYLRIVRPFDSSTPPVTQTSSPISTYFDPDRHI